MNSTCHKICVGNGRFFYFNNDGKLYLCYISKRRYLVIKKSSVIFIEFTEMNRKTSDANGLCISVFSNNMVWYLGVKVNIHNDECLIYISTGKFENGTPIICNKTLYHSCYT